MEDIKTNAPYNVLVKSKVSVTVLGVHDDVLVLLLLPAMAMDGEECIGVAFIIGAL